MDPKAIRQQIRQLEAKSKQDIAALRAQLVLADSGFKPGDKLKSTLHSNVTFQATGSNDNGLTGTRIETGEVIPESDLKNWRIDKGRSA